MKNSKNVTRQVSSMIHSARPTVPPVANIVFDWNLFSFKKWGRTDKCKNNDHNRPWLWVGRVDQREKWKNLLCCKNAAKQHCSTCFEILKWKILADYLHWNQSRKFFHFLNFLHTGKSQIKTSDRFIKPLLIFTPVSSSTQKGHTVDIAFTANIANLKRVSVVIKALEMSWHLTFAIRLMQWPSYRLSE